MLISALYIQQRCKLRMQCEISLLIIMGCRGEGPKSGKHSIQQYVAQDNAAMFGWGKWSQCKYISWCMQLGNGTWLAWASFQDRILVLLYLGCVQATTAAAPARPRAPQRTRMGPLHTQQAALLWDHYIGNQVHQDSWAPQTSTVKEHTSTPESHCA